MKTTGCRRGCWGFLPNCTNGITLGLWFKATEIPTDSKKYGLVSSFQSGKAGGFSQATWMANKRYIGFQFIDPYNGKNWYIGEEFPEAGEWHYYVYAFDYNPGSKPNIRIFKDGIPTANGAYRFNGGDEPADGGRRDMMVFGNFYVDDIHNRLKGLIDNVILFEQSLMESQIVLLDDGFLQEDPQ